jgi:hypothetical protein
MPFGSLCPLPLRLGGSAQEGWPEANHARFCADLEALKRTASLAAWSYTVDASTATVLSYAGQNGAGLAYAPTATRNGTGDVSFAWDSQNFTDEYDIEHPFKIRAVICNGSANFGVAASWEVIARGVRIRRTLNSSGSASNGIVHVRVW